MSASKLKFLVDVGVGEKVEEYLLEKRYDTKAVRSLDQSMSDQEIIRLAALEKRIVITMDKDFGELVYHSGMDHCGILLLRLEDATGSEKQQVIAKILAKYADNMKNNFCVYQNKKFRFRKLSRAK
jgi:predicted nuclease of predicted toxin-antitoxin system